MTRVLMHAFLIRCRRTWSLFMRKYLHRFMSDPTGRNGIDSPFGEKIHLCPRFLKNTLP
jgi:hypothetical protein